MSNAKPPKFTQASRHLDRVVDHESKRLISMLTVAHPTLVINRWPENSIDISIGTIILDDISDRGYHVTNRQITPLGSSPYRRVTISLLRPSCNDRFREITIENLLGGTDDILSEVTSAGMVETPDPPLPVLTILTHSQHIKPATIGGENQECQFESSCETTKPNESSSIKKCIFFKPGVPTKSTISESTNSKTNKIKSDGTTISNSKESPELIKEAGMKLLEAITNLVEQQGLCQQQFKEIVEVLNRRT